MGVEHYTRVRALGKGSFGEVFLVIDKRNGQQYVQKEVDLAQFGAKGRREALKEVAFLNAMHHPYIVAYREFFEHDNGMGRKMLYIIMEFASGGDLDGRIKQQNGRLFPEKQIIEWFVQTCLAVKHIHDRKIIHRDLKCENIFLMKASTSQQSQVKLGDFGISKSMANTMAHAITRIGTPYFLSPEICMNKPYNMKSDMWSLGVVLYEMMSLKHPFDATSMEGLLNKIVKSQPPPLPKSYSIELRTVVDSLLSKQPAKRPTVNALLKLPFLAQYVSAALSPAQMAEEFSHTVLHSDASARGPGGGAAAAAASAQPQLPPSNHINPNLQQQQQQMQQRPPPTGIRAKPMQMQHQQQQQQLPQQQQRYPSIHQQQQQQQQYEEYKESPPSARPPSSARSAYPPAPQSASSSSSASRAPPRAPPSPYAGLSNADAIRMIREKKEHELREARALQLDHQRRREGIEATVAAEQQLQQQQQQLRVREAYKERQLAQPDYMLPPVLRAQQQQGGQVPRGIPSVSPSARGSVAATPLNGAPYQNRGGAALAAVAAAAAAPAPTRLQAAHKAREDELARMRVNYFKDRKMKRESKLAAINQAGGGAGSNRQVPAAVQYQPPQQAYQQQRAGIPPPSAYPPPRQASRPPSADRYGPSYGQQQQQPASMQQRQESRWR